MQANQEILSNVSNRRPEQRERSLALYDACMQTEETTRRAEAYQELYTIVFRTAYKRYGNDTALAQDIAQGTLVFVLEKIGTCRDPSAYITFVLWQMRDVAKRILRREKPPAGHKFQPLEVVSDDQEDMSAFQDKSTFANPEKQGDRQELADLLMEAINCLPDERMKKVIWWRYFDKLKDREIADALKITTGHVAKLRHDGMKRLQHDSKLRAFFDADSV